MTALFTPTEPPGAGAATIVVDELEVAQELVRQARDAGVALTGADGLLKAITKTVIETALGFRQVDWPRRSAPTLGPT